MWDEANEEWVMRQSGVMVELPKLSSSVFIGRTKEGFSMNKVMVGYHGWTHERAPVSDAMIPILADGIKWLGYLPDERPELERRAGTAIRIRASRGSRRTSTSKSRACRGCRYARISRIRCCISA